MIALRLARNGWWGGDPGAVAAAPADQVMRAAHYENFVNDYEAAYLELNREGA